MVLISLEKELPYGILGRENGRGDAPNGAWQCLRPMGNHEFNRQIVKLNTLAKLSQARCGHETEFMCSQKTRGLLDFSTRTRRPN